jgi:alpha-L-rhamnosidase
MPYISFSRSLLFAVLFFLMNTCLALTEPVDLKTEHLKNPLGLDHTTPRLSWRLATDADGTRQVAYAIRAAADPQDLAKGANLLWETGRVASDDTLYIPYGGLPAKSRQRIYWQVRVWDNHGHASAWSESAFWEMGLLSADDWQAQWIEEGIPAKKNEAQPAPYFRYNFELPKEVKQARLYITSHGIYDARINGHRVTEDLFTPGWTSYRSRLQYQVYDVTNLLTEGANAIGAIVGDGWYRGPVAWGRRRFFFGEDLGLLAQLEIQFADGTAVTVSTDEDWKTTKGAILEADNYNGEVYDSRLEPIGWDEPAFDDSGWTSVTLGNHSLENLIASRSVPVRAIEELKPVAMTRSKSGSYIFDLGQNMVGQVRLQIQGTPGETITLRHAEVLDAEGELYTANLRTARQEVRYTCHSSEEESHRSHLTFQGFRFVELVGYSGTPDLETVTGIVVHSEMEPIATFECSDPRLNQLHQNIVWGLKGNFLDFPTDCPQRDERQGWTGDAQVFAPTACFLMDTASFFSKWMADVATDQKADGRVPHLVPDIDGGDGAAGWADAIIFVPWATYQAFGDKKILEDNYEGMRRWIEYVQSRAGDNLIWEGDHQFGDWLCYATDDPSYPGATTNKALIATAYFAHSAGQLAEIAAILEKPEESAEFERLHEGISEAFQKEFITPSGRLLSDTQTSYALALGFDLVPSHLQRATSEYFAQSVERIGHLTTGFLGTPLLNPTLSAIGHHDLAFDLLTRLEYPSWLYPLTKGATTIWERWDGIKPDGSFQDPKMNSFNHYAYGAIGEWIYATIGGIQLVEPGYKDFRLRPALGGGITHARTTHDSPHGLIVSDWELQNGFFHYEVTVPPNTHATIEIPAPQGRTSVQIGTGQNTPGLNFLKEENGYVSYRAVPGTYRLKAPQ